MIPDRVIAEIIRGETNDRRFEIFCADLYADETGEPFVPTSRNYDLGRDLRLATARGQGTVYGSCSLREDIGDKAIEDARSLEKSGAPASLIVFTPWPVSEARARKIGEEVMQAVPAIKQVTVNGHEQLLAMVRRHARAFERWYAGEIQHNRAFLAYEGADDLAPQLAGLRLALVTQLSEDAQILRHSSLRNLVLHCISRAPRSDEMLAKAATDALHLPSKIPDVLVREATQALRKDDLVAMERGRWTLTSKGQAEVETQVARGNKELAKGEQAVLETVERGLGSKLTPDETSLVWGRLPQELALIMMDRGLAIADAVAAVAENRGAAQEEPDLKALAAELATSITGRLGGGERALGIGQAIADGVFNPACGLFKWLSSLCTIYVAACSLGLEPRAQSEVLRRLKGLDLLVDTDVALSFLSEGEPNHAGIKASLDAWKRVGGRVLFTDGTLAEVAHHAWIAEEDFRNCEHFLGRIDDSQALYLIRNAFVRGFRRHWLRSAARRRGGEKSLRAAWSTYISSFRGASQHDTRTSYQALHEVGWTLVSADVLPKAVLEAVYGTLLASRAPKPGEPERNRKDKALRDARLIAALVHQREHKAGAEYGTAVVVSSSPRLRDATRDVHPSLAVPRPVIPPAGLAFLLTLVPNARLTLRSLTGLLLDPLVMDALTPLEVSVYRALASGEQYEPKLGQRHALGTALDKQILQVCAERGQPVREVKRLLTSEKPEDAPVAGKLIGAAVDQVARSSHEAEISRLQAEIEELRRRLGARPSR